MGLFDIFSPATQMAGKVARHERKVQDLPMSVIEAQEHYMPKSVYEGMFDPSGLLKQAYQYKAGPSLLPELDKRMGAIQADPRAIEAMRGEALRQGPSAWAQLQLAAQRGQRMRERGDLATRLSTAMAEQRAAQAMRGGMGQGARERLARTGLREGMRQRADLAARGRQEELGLLSEDEQRRLGLLKQLPGMELAQLQPQFQKLGIWQQMAGGEKAAGEQARRFNIEAALRSKAAQEAAQMKGYEERMKAYGAERTAQAQEDAGKK